MNTPTSYIAYPFPFLKFCPTPPPFPVVSIPHPHCSFFCLVSLAEWVIVPYLIHYFNDIMDLHMLSLGTLVQEGPS